ncbi:hypothetical protein Pcinc_031435 [Petrolisthes cinctipes]|uniref:Uncharacterized protein n=1 Tax=Petrolisthes cinctipes TaxID=88211 RepID=A0AAE1K126_PETCI|nr:hypothetical protein Pcinc_031435 [Petrolisthes cinctipes]
MMGEVAVIQIVNLANNKFVSVLTHNDWCVECELMMSIMFITLTSPTHLPWIMAAELLTMFEKRWLGDTIINFEDWLVCIKPEWKCNCLSTLILLCANLCPQRWDVTEVLRESDNIEVLRESDNMEVLRERDNIEVLRESDNIEVLRESDNIEVLTESDNIEVLRESDNIEVLRESDNIEVLRESDNIFSCDDRWLPDGTQPPTWLVNAMGSGSASQGTNGTVLLELVKLLRVSAVRLRQPNNIYLGNIFSEGSKGNPKTDIGVHTNQGRDFVGSSVTMLGKDDTKRLVGMHTNQGRDFVGSPIPILGKGDTKRLVGVHTNKGRDFVGSSIPILSKGDTKRLVGVHTNQDEDYASSMVYFLEANTLYQTGSYGVCLDTLSNINKQHCSAVLQGFVSWVTGLCLIRVGSPHTALVKLREAVDLSALCVPAVFNIAQVYHEQNKTRAELETLALITEAVTDNKKSEGVMNLHEAVLLLHHTPITHLSQRAVCVLALRCLQSKMYVEALQYFTQLLNHLESEESVTTTTERHTHHLESHKESVTMTGTLTRHPESHKESVTMTGTLTSHPESHKESATMTGTLTSHPESQEESATTTRRVLNRPKSLESATTTRRVLNRPKSLESATTTRRVSHTSLLREEDEIPTLPSTPNTTTSILVLMALTALHTNQTHTTINVLKQLVNDEEVGGSLCLYESGVKGKITCIVNCTACLIVAEAYIKLSLINAASIVCSRLEEGSVWDSTKMEEFESRAWDDTPDTEPLEEDETLSPADVQSNCLRQFSSTDFIMEPGIFSTLKRYFQAGGNPEQVIEMLSENYQAVAQMANLMAEWLILAGASINDVQAMVENHLKQMILKTFDPKKADTIFTEEGDAPAWLTELIEHSTWRSVVYQLAEEFPECLMLNFTIKSPEDTRHRAVVEFAKMVCHGQHTYIYAQVMLQILSQESKGGNNIRRLQQEITKYAINKCLNVTPIQLALNGAMAHPRAAQALAPMLARNALNPADITVLFKLYTSQDPPPVDLIRIPQLLELLIDALFKPGSKVNQEHKTKYFYLLGYSASVYENPKKGNRARQVIRDDLKPTQQAIEKVHNICQGGKSAMELIAEINTLYQCIRFPVVSVGLVRWIECVVNEPSYFKLCTESTPTHLALLDEVVSIHPLLHQRVLALLVDLFESEFQDLEILVQLELRKMLLDRMVNLLSRGCVLPVMKYIKNCSTKGDTDISLIRYFVREVLEIIAPPYTVEFVQLFLPLVENEDITGSMNTDSDLVNEFIAHCKTNYYVM